MKSESPFFNPDLTKQMNRFSAVAEIRFSLLDKFNKDCRALTKMLEKYAVPEIAWVYVEPEYDDPYYGLGWHNGTIVWCSDFDMIGHGISDGLPIYEAPAHVRSWLAEHNVLPLLFQDACLALEELAAKMAKPKRLKPAMTLIDVGMLKNPQLVDDIVEDLENVGYRILNASGMEITVGGHVVNQELCDQLAKHDCLVCIVGDKIRLSVK